MEYEELMRQKIEKAAQELMRELENKMRHDMIGARIYYEDREAGERWLKMQSQKPKNVEPEKTIVIENHCESPVEVSAGLVFQKDGDYFVSVRNGKIAVSKCDCASFKDFDAPPEVIEALERNERRIKEATDEFYNALIAEKREEIERLKAEIAKMPPLDYDKLAENPPELPKEGQDD